MQVQNLVQFISHTNIQVDNLIQFISHKRYNIWNPYQKCDIEGVQNVLACVPNNENLPQVFDTL